MRRGRGEEGREEGGGKEGRKGEREGRRGERGKEGGGVGREGTPPEHIMYHILSYASYLMSGETGMFIYLVVAFLLHILTCCNCSDHYKH